MSKQYEEVSKYVENVETKTDSMAKYRRTIAAEVPTSYENKYCVEGI